MVNVVTGTGLVVNGSDVVLGRRLGKLYFLTRPPELSFSVEGMLEESEGWTLDAVASLSLVWLDDEPYFLRRTSLAPGWRRC